MKKFETIEDIAQIEPSCVALGNFDGGMSDTGS